MLLKKKCLYFCVNKSLINFIACNFFYFMGSTRLKGVEVDVKVITYGVYPLLTFLAKSSSTQFQSLVDIIVYDVPKKIQRFFVIYVVLSIRFNTKVIVTTTAKELGLLLSIGGVHRSAG
jgi:NADH-quinone oxidoreductase subunit C